MYLAIDLGGTKTLIGLLNPNGELKKAVKFPTPKDYQQFLTELKNQTSALIQDTQLESVCMAVPGFVDRENGIITKLGNLDWPRDIPIRADLSAIFNTQILLENDANLAALSEAIALGDEYSKVLYITVSTGIGGGFVIDGKLDEEIIDAEIGHMIFEHKGEILEWEDFASGSWIVKTYDKRASELEDDNAWKVISYNLAIGIINLVNTLTPDVIVIGGGVGTHLAKFKEHLEGSLKHIDPGFNDLPKIVQAQRPEEAVIFGCYELIKQKT